MELEKIRIRKEIKQMEKIFFPKTKWQYEQGNFMSSCRSYSVSFSKAI